MKRIVVIILIACAFFTFSVPVGASDAALETSEQQIEEAAEITPPIVRAEASAKGEDPQNDRLPESDGIPSVPSDTEDSDGVSNMSPDPPLSPDDTEKAPADGAGGNVLTELYELCLQHATQILSALAALTSCLLALGYKRGLLPLLQKGIGVISGTVNQLGENAKNTDATIREQSSQTLHLAERMESTIDALTESVRDVLSRLEGLEAQSSEREAIRIALETEADMLGEIFLASSLPEYRKEKVGNTIAKMKADIARVKGE